jgi:hypothetical protein
MPAEECERKAEPPVALDRQCRGLHARMLAGGSPSEDDLFEISSEPAPAKP